jgi:hypothetical protein
MWVLLVLIWGFVIWLMLTSRNVSTNTKFVSILVAFVSTLIIVGYQQYDAQTMSDDDIALTTSSSDDEEDDTDDDKDLSSDDEEEVDDQDSTEDETDESDDVDTDTNADDDTDVESESEFSVTTSSSSEVSRTYSSSSARTYSRGGTTHNPARAGSNSGTRNYAYKPVPHTADSQTVYVNARIRGRYHKNPNCQGLRQNGGGTPMTFAQAKQQGYVALCTYERY